MHRRGDPLGYVLGQYACWLGSAELEPGVEDLDELWLQDDDYLLLYNSEIAQNDEVLKALEEQLFTVNLDFASWFKPFDKAYKIPPLPPSPHFVGSTAGSERAVRPLTIPVCCTHGGPNDRHRRSQNQLAARRGHDR